MMWKEFATWDSGHSVTRNTKNQQKSDAEPRQEEGKEGIFWIQKTVIVTHQPELQKIMWISSMTGQWHKDTVTQFSRFLSSWLVPFSSRSCWSLGAQCTKLCQDKGLCGLLQCKLCAIMTIISGIQLKLTSEHENYLLPVWERCMPQRPYRSQSKNSAQIREREMELPGNKSLTPTGQGISVCFLSAGTDSIWRFWFLVLPILS